MKKFFQKIFESKTFKNIMYVFAFIAFVLIIFRAGMIVGYKKTMFRCDWGKNYEMNFGPHKPLPEMNRKEPFGDFSNAHGTIGKIIRIDLPSIVVLDEKEKIEKVILIDEKTEIINNREYFKKENLKLDERVIIIGAPNSLGQIEARFIRLFSSPTREPGLR